MRIISSQFGEIEINNDSIITFNEGLPGFYDLRCFALLSDANEDGLIFHLQSIDSEEVAFVLVDMAALAQDYDPLVDPGHLDGLGEYEPENFLILNVATIPENIHDITVNLKAPIVINWELKRGKQVVCANEEYHVRHRLFALEE
ncbi:MAG: flagellar assembly protein FliW [Defluviitaleaceae bacterium]|nr:flagellar assembly protein FliW [Defluviitaleaceae bacterium]